MTKTVSTLFFLFAILSTRVVLAGEISQSFMLTLWDSPVDGESYFYNTPDSKVLNKVNLQQVTRSPIYTVDAQKINIHMKKGDKIKQIASVKLNPKFKCSLVILKASMDGEYESIELEDRPESLPFGSYLLYNHSKLNIEGVLGKTTIELSPHTAQLVTPKASKDESFSLELWLKNTKENEKKIFLQRNTLSYRTNKYLIMLLYAEKKANGRIHLKSKAIVKFKDTE